MRLVRRLAWFLLALPGAGCGDDGPPADARPNLVLILSDDQRYDTLGCNGNTIIHQDEVLQYQELVRRVPVPEHIYEFAVDLARRTRPVLAVIPTAGDCAACRSMRSASDISSAVSRSRS